MKNIIDSLSRKKLEDLYNELIADGKDLELIEYVSNRINYINSVNCDFDSYSSSRVVEHSHDDENRCKELFYDFCVGDFPFLVMSFYGNTNKKKVFIYNGHFCDPSLLSLMQLDNFFLDEKNISDYEASYNALNMIKSRIYSSGSDSLFKDSSKKKEICKLRFGDITKYICEIKNGTKLKLSTGERGVGDAVNGGFKESSLSHKAMIDGYAFSTSLEKLESGNYEDCKRLLYLPRNVRNK